MSQHKHECAVDNARKFWDWIKGRGGVAVWPSIHWSNPGMSWSTPARQPDGSSTPKPNWQAADEPERIVTDPAEILVYMPREVHRLHVAVRKGQGLSLEITDGSLRRINKVLAKHGKGSFHTFDYDTQEAVVYVPDREVPLDEYAKEQGWA